MTHLEAVQTLFRQLGWNARILQDYPVVTCAVAVPNGTLDVFCHIHSELERVLFYVRPQGLEIDPQHMAALAEFLTRANYGLPLGNFEMDWDDVEINCKSSIQVPASQISPELLQVYLLHAVETCNHYLPGLRAVICGESTAKEAIRVLEPPLNH